MLLAIDCSTQWIGLALHHDDLVLAEMIWRTSNHHSVELTPGIERILHLSNVNQADLEAVAVATGPGSFTSLRIGLAVAKGLALGLSIPIIGIPTLDVQAAGIPLEKKPLACVLQAGRGRLAVGWYEAADDRWRSRGEPEVITVEDLEQAIKKPTLVAGELNTEDRRVVSRRWKNAHLVSPAYSLRRPSFLAELAIRRWDQMDVDHTASLAPVYLHHQDAIPI